MKFPFATVNASKFRRLPSRKNACNFSDRGKNEGKTENRKHCSGLERGGWKRISIFICIGRFAIRFKPPRTLPRSSYIAIRIYSPAESNYRQIWVIAYGTSIQRSRRMSGLRVKNRSPSPERFSSDVITNCKDFSIFRIRSMEFKAFQDRFDRDVHEMSIRIQRVSNYLYKPSCT